MRTNIALIFSILITVQTIGQTVVSTPNIEASIQNGKLLQLKNKLTATTWSVKQDSLYNMTVVPATTKDKILTQFIAQADELGQVKLTLSFKNNSSQAVEITTVFPNIQELFYPYGSDQDLYYLYPKMGWAPYNANIEQDNIYGRWFPLQVIDVYNRFNGGFYFMTNDTTNYPKKYYFKKSAGKTNIKVTHHTKKIAPGETWVLPPAVIGAHQGDWHAGLQAYKDWVKTWYTPLSPRKQWFQDIYNMRQLFMHTNFGEKGVWNPITREIDISNRVEEEKTIFGGIDYVHIFDWMREPEDRIFNYEPWTFLGGSDNLKQEIVKLRQKGIRTGLYYQGYKIHRQSEIGLLYGDGWKQINAAGVPYDANEPGYFYPCAYVKGWQDYFSNLAGNTTNLLDVNGAYIDQYGFGYQYGCYDPSHGHPVTQGPVSINYQNIGEVNMMKAFRSKLSDSIALYVEEMPTDVSTQYLDGSYTYAVNKSKFNPAINPSAVNLFRFVFPDFKLFELLQVDSPIGNDTIGIKNIFFNGEGNWIEGPLNDLGWFPEPVRRLIRKTHAIMSQHKEPFRSNDAVPLVSTLNQNVYANYFPSERKNIWTLFNAGTTDVNGDLIKILHKPGAVYYDAWNGKSIPATVSGGYVTISMKIAAKDAGCIIQSLDPVQVVFPVEPPALIPTLAESVKMKTAKLKGENVTLQIAAGGTGRIWIDWGDGNKIEYYNVSENVNTATQIVQAIPVDNAEIVIYVESRYLTYLTCASNLLTQLDVSKAEMLRYLRCHSNSLTTLDLSRNLELILMYCYSNQLTSLDVANCYQINDLQIGTNKIPSVNVEKLYNLTRFYANLNPLGMIDLSKNKLLKTLVLRNCSLKKLDLSQNKVLSSVDISNTGPTYANRFSACGLDSLYSSLFDRTALDPGEIKIIYSKSDEKFNSGISSNKNIATERNWTVKTYINELMTGNGGGCDLTTVPGMVVTDSKIKFYLGQGKETLHLQINQDYISAHLIISDLAGAVFVKTKINALQTEHDISVLPKGIYILRINNLAVKFIKD